MGHSWDQAGQDAVPAVHAQGDQDHPGQAKDGWRVKHPETGLEGQLVVVSQRWPLDILCCSHTGGGCERVAEGVGEWVHEAGRQQLEAARGDSHQGFCGQEAAAAAELQYTQAWHDKCKQPRRISLSWLQSSWFIWRTSLCFAAISKASESTAAVITSHQSPVSSQ
jgi:hypothetical protein